MKRVRKFPKRIKKIVKKEPQSKTEKSKNNYYHHVQ